MGHEAEPWTCKLQGMVVSQVLQLSRVQGAVGLRAVAVRLMPAACQPHACCPAQSLCAPRQSRQCVEWSLQMMTVGAMRLREMERAAKAAKRGVWHSYVPVATGQTKLSDSFVGRVNEVASGDTLIVKDVNAGVERRVQLSR